MIIRKDGSFEQNSLYPSTDWYKEGNLIINESTPEGAEMARIISLNYPFVEIECRGDYVIKAIPISKPVKPIDLPGKRLELVKNGGIWEYTYIDELEIDTLDTLKERIVHLEEQLAQQKNITDLITKNSEVFVDTYKQEVL